MAIKRFFQILALLTLTVVAQAQTLDRVIAIVDNDVIMASELAERTRSVLDNIQQSNTQAPPLTVIQAQVLDRLILENLQLQMAGRAHVEVDEATIDKAIDRIVAESGQSREQYFKIALSQGLTERKLREQVRREMVLQRVQRGFVNSRIEISEHEIDNFLESSEGKLWLSPEYALGHILVAVPSDASPALVERFQQKAEGLYQSLEKGADFGNLAIENSDGQNAANGGDLGWRKEAQLPEIFVQALPDIEVGGITKPFRSGAGFHILKLYNQRGVVKHFVDQTKASHILLKPSEILSDDEAFHQLVDLRDKILSGEVSFHDMARKYSEDIGSALGGGDLGWVLPGMMVPEFDKVMNETAIGEISMPFKSEFGWHILTVEERRKQDMTKEYTRNQVANLLRSKRFDDELQQWLSDIMEDAYIERKIDFDKLSEGADGEAVTTVDE